MNDEEKEISILDILIVIAENLKMLVLGPILVGVLALGVSYLLPQRFVSQAILALPTPAPVVMLTPTTTSTPPPTPTPTQAAVMMTSPIVLDPVITALNLSGGRPIQVVRAVLTSQVKAVVSKDGLLRIDVTANTPREAQTIANAVIETWLKSTAPGALDRADLEKRLSYAKSSLDSVSRLLDRMAVEGPANLNKPLTRGEAGTGIVVVGELQARYLAEVLNIPRALQGLSRDVVVQPPTLPTQPETQKKGLTVFLAALGTCVTLLLWIFMRQAWKNGALDPYVAKKQAKLFAAIGMKSRAH